MFKKIALKGAIFLSVLFNANAPYSGIKNIGLMSGIFYSAKNSVVSFFYTPTACIA